MVSLLVVSIFFAAQFVPSIVLGAIIVPLTLLFFMGAVLEEASHQFQKRPVDAPARSYRRKRPGTCLLRARSCRGVRLRVKSGNQEAHRRHSQRLPL